MRQRLVIRKGYVTGFADEVLLPMTDVVRRRVSHVVPSHPVLRACFQILRAIVPERGRIAEWTRSWRCDWRVLIGRESFGPFVDRAEAIRFEKAHIAASGMDNALRRADRQQGNHDVVR